LEQLHEHRKATADHTTLLLNCYAKLKDINKLEKFIKSPGDLKFDLDTAIAMCRQGGYYEQAAYLAKKHGETDLVVDILIEDSKNYIEALDYVWRQDPDIVRMNQPQSRMPANSLGVSLSTKVRTSVDRELPPRCYKAIRGLLYRQLQTPTNFDSTARHRHTC
jgi:hypothetical protein